MKNRKYSLSMIMFYAREHLVDAGDSRPSASLCYQDAVELRDQGHTKKAYHRALESLRHSVGVFHSDFKRFK